MISTHLHQKLGMVAILIGMQIGLTTCSTEAADGPGLCKLSCGSAIIAPNDYVIKKQGPDVDVRCSASDVGKAIKIPVRFAIFKKVKVGDAPEKEISVPNISITPLVIGAVARGESSIDGVLESDSVLCSDSCGAVSFHVLGLCPAQQQSQVSVSIASGSLISPEAIKATFYAPDTEANSNSDDDVDDTNLIKP
jgi:hypothetical protein